MQLLQARTDTKSSNFLLLSEGTADRNQNYFFNRVLHDLSEFFFPLYAEETSLFHLVLYRVIQNNCRSTIVQRQFRTKFGKQPSPDNPIRRWCAQFQGTGCVCIPELKVRIRTANETITADMLQFGTNSIIVLMFVESQRVHI